MHIVFEEQLFLIFTESRIVGSRMIKQYASYKKKEVVWSTNGKIYMRILESFCLKIIKTETWGTVTDD